MENWWERVLHPQKIKHCSMKKICIIGVGIMGRAMLDILSAKKLYNVVGCDAEDDPNVVARDADVVIFAVKPQSFKQLSESIKIDLRDKLIISIMAGISVEKIRSFLNTEKVVRTMPNLAIKVGQSMTLWVAGGAMSDEDKSLVVEILGMFGVGIEVDDESKIGIMTSINGSGPAYFAYMGEKMADFCVKNGFPPEQSAIIARQTLIGTGEVVKESGWSLTELRERVSSKGGTTEKAINTLEENNFGDVFQKGIEAAVTRTKELNQ